MGNLPNPYSPISIPYSARGASQAQTGSELLLNLLVKRQVAIFQMVEALQALAAPSRRQGNPKLLADAPCSESGISRWRGTEVRRFVVGFSQIECALPSRTNQQPC